MFNYLPKYDILTLNVFNMLINLNHIVCFDHIITILLQLNSNELNI